MGWGKNLEKMFYTRSLWPGLLSLVLLMLACNTLSPHIQPTTTDIATSTTTPHPTAIPTPTPTRAPQLGDTWTRPADGMVMMYVPEGEFVMGITDDLLSPMLNQCVTESDGKTSCELWLNTEQPAHTVVLDTFWIDQMEVSVAQFRAFVVATGYTTTAEVEQNGWTYTPDGTWQWIESANWQHPQGIDSTAQDDYPVVLVSWNDAFAYCAWVGGQLPTEAQWEYAARGPENRVYPWGNEFDGTRVNYCDASCPLDWKDVAYTDGYALWSPVGSYPAGASWVGALDMAGNVWEWTADRYERYSSRLQENPTGAISGNFRVHRGGSWCDTTWLTHTATRSKEGITSCSGAIGFRCVVVDQGQ